MVFNSSFLLLEKSIILSALDVEELLRSPIIDYRDVDIKFKRTKQIVDKTSFILKLSIAGEGEKIDPFRLELYTGTLVEKSFIDRISDLSTDSEQIMLVQCKCEIGHYSSVRSKFIFRSFFSLNRFRQSSTKESLATTTLW